MVTFQMLVPASNRAGCNVRSDVKGFNRQEDKNHEGSMRLQPREHEQATRHRDAIRRRRTHQADL